MRSRVVVAAGRIALLPLLATILSFSQGQPSKNTEAEIAHRSDLYKAGGDVTRPRAIYAPDPEYSEQARKHGLEGTCVLSAIVDSEGTPRDIRVTQSIGMGLDENAVEALRTWKFEPARRNDTPVPAEVTVEMSFHLGGDDSRLAEYLTGLKAKLPPPRPALLRIVPCNPVQSEASEPEDPEISVADLIFENVSQLSVAEQDRIAASLKQRFYSGTIEAVTNEVRERTKVAWQERGYFKVQAVADSKVLTASPIGARIAVTVRIEEGKQYRLGSIVFRNNKAVSDAGALRHLFPIADGDLLDREKIAIGLEAVRKAYGEMGYINFTTTPETTFDEERNLGSLVVTLDEGKQFYVSSIEILGLDDRMLHAGSEGLSFRVGDVYNLRLLDLSLKKQASLLNSNIGPVEEHLDETKGTVAVTIDLRQCPL